MTNVLSMVATLKSEYMACKKFILEGKIESHSYTCDCMALTER